MSARTATLLSVACPPLSDHEPSAFADLADHVDPDLLTVTREGTDARVLARLRRALDAPVAHVRGQSRPVTIYDLDATTVAVARSTDDLARCAAVLREEATAADRQLPTADALVAVDLVLCDGLAVEADPVSMTVALDGRDAAARFQAATPASVTFCTGSAPGSYAHTWTARVDEAAGVDGDADGSEGDGADGPSDQTDGPRDQTDGPERDDAVELSVRGLAPLPRSGVPELPIFTIDATGAIALDSVPADRFGLRALAGVGPARADALREAGYGDRAAVAAAAPDAIAGLDGVGESAARQLHAGATALVEGRVVRTDDEALPPTRGRDVLFVDVETDGLSPTVIWLVGCYDPAADEYVDFVDPEPSREEPGRATRAFVEQLAAEYDRPALVAWNGHGFDFPHLTRFVAAHAPAYREFWRDAVATYDPYDWAVRRGHAVLPGRTDRLEAVAGALGVDSDDGGDGGDAGDAAVDGPPAAPDASPAAASGPTHDDVAMDGATLGRAVRRSLAVDEPPAIDIDAARAYCEADVRALAAVYDAIDAAPTPAERAGRPSAGTQQSGLAEF